VDRLTEIIATRRNRVAEARHALPCELLEKQARDSRADNRPHALLSAFSLGDDIKIIAEFKRRSPSKGSIKSNANAPDVTLRYESGGAAAISVLTEPDYFDGSLEDLVKVRRTTALPILRKDFIFDEYQVYESAAAGADALLLIVAALKDRELKALRRLTEDELGIDALVEVHTADEMRRAIDCGAKIIGVNNRSLSTFEVLLNTSIELSRHAPRDTVLISESGIATRADIDRLRAVGYRGFLIGETLMRAADPEALLAELTGAKQAVKIR
jgi:indole-3-glycerol phosphate synthase